MLIGNIPAKIDDKGRLKIPNAFRAHIAEKYGREVFVTSLTGESVRVYPLPVLLAIQQGIQESPSSVKAKFLERISFYGQLTEFDDQGRLIIQPRLRVSALMTGDVDVIAKTSYLDVWNHDRMQSKLDLKPLSEQDMRELEDLGF